MRYRQLRRVMTTGSAWWRTAAPQSKTAAPQMRSRPPQQSASRVKVSCLLLPLLSLSGHGRQPRAQRVRLIHRDRPVICSFSRAEFVMAEPKKPRPSSPRASLSAIRRQAEVCRRCDLWKHATQTVFGNGPSGARIMLVGEQPGDAEDLEGKPFVGPAGQLLRHALEDAGIDLRDVYLTNVVKH